MSVHLCFTIDLHRFAHSDVKRGNVGVRINHFGRGSCKDGPDKGKWFPTIRLEDLTLVLIDFGSVNSYVKFNDDGHVLNQIGTKFYRVTDWLTGIEWWDLGRVDRSKHNPTHTHKHAHKHTNHKTNTNCKYTDFQSLNRLWSVSVGK